MFKRTILFCKREDGAVTVDWVVLTAAIVGIAAGVFVVFHQPVRDLDARSGAALSGIDVADEISVRFDAPDS